MRYSLSLIMFFFLGWSSLNAQTLITCSNSRTNARVDFVSKRGKTIKVKVHWDEGSTFAGGNLVLTNARCTDCPRIGGIGRPHGKDKTYTLTQTDLNKPVTIAWKVTQYCGNQVATIPGTEAQEMACTGSRSGAKASFISKRGKEIKLKVEWDEGSTFAGGNLVLTNADCTDCPRIGGIGRPHGKEKTYTITQKNTRQPVNISWKVTQFCGNDSIEVPAN